MIHFIDGLNNILFLISIAAVIGMIVSYIVMKANEHHNYDNHVDSDYATAKAIFSAVRFPTICLVVLAVIFNVMLVFIPTQKEYAAMYVIPKIATEQNMDKLKSISSDMFDAACDWIKSISKESNKLK
jgi:predicted permease